MEKASNPEQLKALLSLNPEDVLIKPREEKEDTGKILAIKLSDEEASLIKDFQNFLLQWGYLPGNSFESLFIFLFNLGCSLCKQMVEYETKMGRAYDPEDLVPKSQD